MPPSPPVSDATREFGERVRARRKELGWSQETLAQTAGMHWSHLSHIERGQRNLSLHAVLRIADSLQVEPGYLLNGLPVPVDE